MTGIDMKCRYNGTLLGKGQFRMHTSGNSITFPGNFESSVNYHHTAMHDGLSYILPMTSHMQANKISNFCGQI